MKQGDAVYQMAFADISYEEEESSSSKDEEEEAETPLHRNRLHLQRKHHRDQASLISGIYCNTKLVEKIRESTLNTTDPDP